MLIVLEVLFALFLGAICALLCICAELLDFAADHGFPDAGRHRAAEGLDPDAEPVGAAADTEVLRI